MADETGVEELISTIRVDASQTKPGSVSLGTDVQLLTLSAGTTSGVLFEGDRIKIEGSYHPEQMYVVYAASTCASARVASSGSLESKLEALSDAIVEGVTVERVGPDADNGFEWRVTFLDDSPT